MHDEWVCRQRLPSPQILQDEAEAVMQFTHLLMHISSPAELAIESAQRLSKLYAPSIQVVRVLHTRTTHEFARHACNGSASMVASVAAMQAMQAAAAAHRSGLQIAAGPPFLHVG